MKIKHKVLQDGNMILLQLLTLILVVSVQQVTSVGRFLREDVANQWQNSHLQNMTEMLCKDAMYKLRQADYVQTEYKHTMGYELGIIACGIMEKFKHMIRVYRYYSNPSMFKDHKHTVEMMLNGYSSLQSDYNELVNEIVLYYEVLVEQRKHLATRYHKARVYAKKYKMTVETVLNLMDKGIDIEDMQNFQSLDGRRRSMPTDSPAYDEFEDQALLKELSMARNETLGPIPKESKNSVKNIFAKKKASPEEAEYKKKLRYIMWAEKWDGYNPATEGVHIDDTIAKLGLNESNYLLNEITGDV